MTRVAYELAQFVNDLRTITTEMHDPRASLVRVPLALASTRLVSARLGPKRRQRVSAVWRSRDYTSRSQFDPERGTHTRRSAS
jgi:hypothetical protein